MREKSVLLAMTVAVCLFFMLVAGRQAYAEKGFAAEATINAINLKAKSMKVTYTDFQQVVKQSEIWWDNTSEFYKKAPAPEMAGKKIKPKDLKKGSIIFVVVTNRGDETGRLWIQEITLQK